MRYSGFVYPNPRARSASGFGYTNPLLSSVFSDLTHLKQIVIFYDWMSCSWYSVDEIVFNNYISIIETLPLCPSYITYQLYKYIPWTWQICHIISIHEYMRKLISTFNYWQISILCCCYLLFVNIIPNVLWKLYITWPCYAYSMNRNHWMLNWFTHKNHSGPIISAMAVCNMHGISSALLTYMQHFSAGAFNSVIWHSGNVSNCQANYLGSNPGWVSNYYNHWKQIKLRNFTAMISNHEWDFPLRNCLFVVPNPLLIRK